MADPCAATKLRIIGHPLAAFGAQRRGLRADRADPYGECGSGNEHSRRGAAEVGAIVQEGEVARVGVTAAAVKAVLHGLEAGALAGEAARDAFFFLERGGGVDGHRRGKIASEVPVALRERAFLSRAESDRPNGRSCEKTAKFSWSGRREG